MKKKVIIGLASFFILSILSFFIFFPFDSFIKEKIEQTLGPAVSIKKIKIRWNSITGQDIIIKTPSGTEFLTIKELKLKLYFLALLRKEFEIKEIQMNSPVLFLIKNKKGKWLLPVFKEENQNSHSQLSIKEFKVTKGTVIIHDEIKGSFIKLENVDITIKQSFSLFRTGNTIIRAFAKCNGGPITLISEGKSSKKQFNGTLTIKDLNIKVLRPYIKGDVIIKKGLLSLDSNFSINKGYVKAPSILKAKGIEIEPKGFLMGISAPLLIELLKKEKEIVLPFNIWGRWDNLQTDLEESIKRKVSEEVGKTITSPFRIITKPLKDLFKKIH